MTNYSSPAHTVESTTYVTSAIPNGPYVAPDAHRSRMLVSELCGSRIPNGSTPALAGGRFDSKNRSGFVVRRCHPIAHTDYEVSALAPTTARISDRVIVPVERLDWHQISNDLDEQGYAVVRQLLTSEECDELAALYSDDQRFRSRIVMERFSFGRGEYKYFNYPLPDIISELRPALYSRLQPIANHWNQVMGIEVQYPKEHSQFIHRCHKAGQLRPTPLLLQYGPGDFNCLHQDLYGEHAFPMQVTVLLSRAGRDFTGGEFLLVEQRPRMQSRAEVVPLTKGDAVAFAVHHRPVRGKRGYYRVNLRHGVSRVRSGRRHTLGIIFHDAK